MPEPQLPDPDTATEADWNAHFILKQRWQQEDKLIKRQANRLASSIGFAIRQHYNWGPTQPEFLAMSDIDMRLEYHAIEAWKKHTLKGKLPRGVELVEGESDAFEEIAALEEQGLLSDAFWDDVTDIPESQWAPHTLSK